MRLSQESRYGLEGLRILARQPEGKAMLLQEIADLGGLPAGFLAQIFQKLSRHHLVFSHRGAVRGYALVRPPAEISLRKVVEAIEGPELFDRCAFRPHRCGDGDPCLLHEILTPVRDAMLERMERTTLADLIRGGCPSDSEREGTRGRGVTFTPQPADMQA